MLGYKIGFNKFKKIEIILSMFFDYNHTPLEIKIGRKLDNLFIYEN